MAEQNWSKEPWTRSTEYDRSIYTPNWEHITRCDGIEYGPANARRIVACVNACTGIPSEALEAGVIKELVEALKCIKAECGAVCQDFDLCDDPACASSYGAWETANQAIAKLQQPEESQ